MIFQATYNATNDLVLIVNERNAFRFDSGEWDKGVYQPGKVPTPEAAEVAAQIAATIDPLTEEAIGELSEEDFKALEKALSKPITSEKQTEISDKSKGR